MIKDFIFYSLPRAAVVWARHATPLGGSTLRDNFFKENDKLNTVLIFTQLAALLERDTSKYSGVIQLLLDKSVVTVDYDDICEHMGDVNEF